MRAKRDDPIAKGKVAQRADSCAWHVHDLRLKSRPMSPQMVRPSRKGARLGADQGSHGEPVHMLSARSKLEGPRA